jgi:signal transduction histidine kinase
VKRTPWLSWRLFFLTFPIDVTVLLLSSDHAGTGRNDYFEWFLLALVAHSSIAPFVAIALFFTSKANSWKTELCALLILGAVRGIAIHFGLGILDLESKVSSLYKVFNSTISLPLWFIGLALFVESRRQFQQEFEALFLRSMRKEQISSGKQEISSAGMRDGQLIVQLQSLASGLAKEIEEALNHSTAKIDYAVQASKIQDLIKNKLRPASAELWNGATLSPPKLSASELIKVSLLEQKLKVPAACLIFAPYIFIGLNGSHGWRFSAIETLIATILNALIFAIFEMLFKNGLLTRKSTNILIIGSSYAIPLLAILYVIPENLFWIDSDVTKLIYQLCISSFHVAILLSFNLYESLSNRRSAVLANLERITQGKNLFSFSDSEHTAARDIDLARYLHGELQAGLIATSLLLESAIKSGDANLANHTLRSAVDILNQDHARVSESRKSSPRTRLEKISSGWRGIAEVQIRLDWIDDLEGALLNDVIALIDESVSNAIRHAKASFILVAGSRTTTDLNFEVLSDGSGMTFKSVGLGTKLFQELTSNWVYTKQGDLNLLKFTVFTTVYE